MPYLGTRPVVVSGILKVHTLGNLLGRNNNIDDDGIVYQNTYCTL